MTTMTDSELQQVEGRAQRYWNSDGIPETMLGAFWLVWGGVVLLPIVIPNRQLIRIQSVILMIAMGAMMIFMGRIAKAWKERVTYPRTGYVEMRKPKAAVRVASAAIAVAFGTEITVLSVHGGSSFSEWMPLGLGLLLAAFLTRMAWTMRSARLAILSPLVAVAAIVAALRGFGLELSIAIVFLAAGLVCLTDGVLVLRSYLRAHPMPAGEQP